MSDPKPEIVLVDDLRSFVDGRQAEVARTSSAGVSFSTVTAAADSMNSGSTMIWGDDDTIWPVVEVLERVAFECRPFDIGVVIIHSDNPEGAAKIAQALQSWTYPVRVAAGDPAVGYIDGVDSAG